MKRRDVDFYDQFILECISKDNYEFRIENDQLKGMIERFISGKYSKDQLILEYQQLIDKGKFRNQNKKE